jgi:hypothetical protein
MHVIRAREHNNKREIGLRRFFADNQYSYLTTENILQELIRLINFCAMLSLEKIQGWKGRLFQKCCEIVTLFVLLSK